MIPVRGSTHMVKGFGYGTNSGTRATWRLSWRTGPPWGACCGGARRGCWGAGSLRCPTPCAPAPTASSSASWRC
eukprot:4345968-Pyramimonas_sp.AAC.1